MHISDEDLIEYLQGTIPTAMRDEIDCQLAVDQSLVHRLSGLRNLLGQIDSLHGVYEPPADLVDATLARIDAEAADRPPVAANRPASTAQLVSVASRSRSTFWDSSALTISLTLLCCLVLPAMVRARFESRKVQCANNLRLTGKGLINFAINDPNQRFPHIDLTGPFSFAGVYAIHLKSFGIPISPGQLRCASLLGARGNVARLQLSSIPTLHELPTMDWYESRVQQAIGGDYAYNLGVIESEAVVAPKYAGRAQFAILADSPVFIGAQEQLVAHDGRGLNILYEDGRVVFLNANVVLRNGPITDHPFRNLRGDHAVGLFPQDASLAPSHYSPLGNRY